MSWWHLGLKMQLEGEGKQLLVGLAVIVDCSSVVVSFTFKLGSILARTVIKLPTTQDRWTGRRASAWKPLNYFWICLKSGVIRNCVLLCITEAPGQPSVGLQFCSLSALGRGVSALSFSLGQNVKENSKSQWVARVWSSRVELKGENVQWKHLLKGMKV